jgi:hypothetical protein
MRTNPGVPPNLDRRRFGIALLVTIATTMLLAVAVNFVGLSNSGRQISYGVIIVAGIAILFGYVARSNTRQ